MSDQPVTMFVTSIDADLHPESGTVRLDGPVSINLVGLSRETMQIRVSMEDSQLYYVGMQISVASGRAYVPVGGEAA